MKKLVLILGVFITVIIFSFTSKKSTSIATEAACYPSVQLQSTVLTLEESQNMIEVPFTGKSFIGFTQAVGFKESRNRYHIVNKFGYLGKYQFGKSTLRRLKVKNVENFLSNPEQQEQAFSALCSLNKYILRNDIKRSVGKKINGIEITESGILAAAHLSGAGNVKKYLRTNGQNNKQDAFGTSIETYMKRFAGYDVSNIEANRFPKV